MRPSPAIATAPHGRVGLLSAEKLRTTPGRPGRLRPRLRDQLPDEHSCVRCPVLRIDPGQRARLTAIRDNLTARVAEAEREGWLGEAEGLRVSLAAARDKLAQLDERTPPSRHRQDRWPSSETPQDQLRRKATGPAADSPAMPARDGTCAATRLPAPSRRPHSASRP